MTGVNKHDPRLDAEGMLIGTSGVPASRQAPTHFAAGVIIESKVVVQTKENENQYKVDADGMPRGR